MEDPKAVILSAIGSLDGWLVKKDDPWEHSYEKLGSLVVGMADFGEEDKEKILRFMVGMADSWDEKKRERLSWWEDPWESNKEKMYRLVVRSMIAMNLSREDRLKKMCSLVSGMVEFWEDNNNREKLYRLLVRVAFPGRDKVQKVDKDVVFNILCEVMELWGVNLENLNKLLKPIYKQWRYCSTTIYTKKLHNLVVEIATNQMWKLNKEKLYTWLASKVDDFLYFEEELFGFMLDIARYEDDNTDIRELTRKNVEVARNELGLILDFITDNKLEEYQASNSLHYFICDAVEMANNAHRLIQLKDSDPFILFLQSFILQDHDCVRGDAEQFSEKIKTIYNWLQKMKECMFECGSVEKTIGPQHDVVGLEEDIDLLLCKEDIGTVTFIRGMTGIGKTTLAREVYNRAIVDDRFERCAWVCVSRRFSRKEMLMSLLLQVVEVDKRDGLFENMDSKSLRHMVRQHLEGKHYFIVLDGVWDEAYMKYVMKAFPQGKKSRLLLTTSNTFIRVDHNKDYDHHMKLLDDEKSWKLLLNALFFGVTDKKFPKHFEKKGKEMVTKCGGLPLAILELGRQWIDKRQSGIEWEELLNEAPKLDETLMALELTYRDFDPELRSCFLHLALFKKGAAIKARRLVHIWMVGGVKLDEWQFYQHYLPRLSKESIIHVMDMDKVNCYIRTCLINVVFHMLSVKIAKDELCFEILHKDGENQPSHEARHRAIYCSREKLMFNCSMNQDEHLVSLFFHGGGYFDASPSYWKQFEQLKILDMEDFGLKVLPDAIGALSELRYLGLRNNYVQELPRSFDRLKKLEVLDLAHNFMVSVPDIIWDMDSLCHLYISDICCDVPLKIDALRKLRTLNFISIDSWTYEQSGLKNTNLFRLGVEEVDESSDMRKLFASLDQLDNFQCLKLRGFRFRSMPSLDELGILEELRELKLEGKLTRLPKFPLYIRQLTLVNSCLDEDPMPILEKLSNLFYLRLQNAYVGEQMVISPKMFPQLEYLVIGEFWHLRNVQVAKGTMLRLRQLEIYSCPYLEILPEEILMIDSLEKLTIVTTRNIAMKIKESSTLSRISEVDIQP